MFDENLAYDNDILYKVIGKRNNKEIVIYIRSLVQLSNFLDLELSNFDDVTVLCLESEDYVC